MKKLILAVTIVTASAVTMYGQSRIDWNNFSGGTITVGTLNMGPTGGNAGDGIGADSYSVQLIWASGTYADQTAFDGATQSLSPVISMFPGSITGNATTGAGFYDYNAQGAGSLGMGGPAGTYTVQLRAWYSVGNPAWPPPGTVNWGLSSLGTIDATVAPSLAPALNLPAFTVGVIPEPSTMVLAGLGLASLLIFRRRK